MRDKILQNERYGVLEINKDAVITGYNKRALYLLSDFCENNSIEDLHCRNIFNLKEAGENNTSDSMNPVLIISSASSITVIDSFSYPETDSVIIRFTGNDDGLYPFLNVFRHSSSVFFELDNDLNFIFASDSFFRLCRMERADIYGKSISFYTTDKDFDLFRTAVSGSGINAGNYIEVDGFLFSFDGNVPDYKIEVYPVFIPGGGLYGYFCFIPDSTLQKKCRGLELAAGRINEVVNFTSTVSHDFNNALTAVLGNISLAKMESGDKGELAELLADVESAALKIKNLNEKLGMFIRSMRSQIK